MVRNPKRFLQGYNESSITAQESEAILGIDCFGHFSYGFYCRIITITLGGIYSNHTFISEMRKLRYRDIE